MTRATLDKQPHEVAAMFDRVAAHYDRTNTVLAFAIDKAWRRATRRALGLSSTDRCLDVAAGTAISTEELALSGADVVACDFSLGMLRAGRHRGLPLIAGDALRLPFADASFDAVTISFGLRNVADVDAALTEFARVTKPAGRLVVCEFSHPTWAPLRTIYNEYLMRAVPPVARMVSSNPDAYVYLAESIPAWPNQEDLANRISGAGWTQVAWKSLTGGIVALHRAVRPAN